jgi:flagellar biosynthesis protein FlhG
MSDAGPPPERDSGVSASERASTGPGAAVPRVIAIGGGKGGIGKSLLAAGIGVELARTGSRVVVVDCDLGGANLHSLLGLALPKGTLSDFLLRRVPSLDTLVVETAVTGLGLISGARNAIQMANPLHQQKLRLMRALLKVPADAVVLDLGAGTHLNVVDFFLLARHGILVAVPEPTSVENAYRFIKAAFLRKLRMADGVVAMREIVEEVVRERAGLPPTAAELLSAIALRDPEAGNVVAREIAAFRPLLVVNQVRENADLRLGDGIVAAVKSLFGIQVDYLGHLRYDDQVWRAVRSRQPFLLDQLGRPFEAELAAIVRQLVDRFDSAAMESA